MDLLIEMFHVDIKLLLAQAINFAIVIFVLYFFALKPILSAMKERADRIEKSLKDAAKIEKDLSETRERCQEELRNAKKEAVLIIAKATEEAESKKEKMIGKAKEDISLIIDEEKSKLQEEKIEIIKDIKANIADLVIGVAEKVIEKKLDSSEDKKLIEKMLK